MAPRLVERRLAAIEARVDLDIIQGRNGGLAELRELTALHPLRESLWLRLLVLLSRSGRPGEALAQYKIVRARLADELGTDPGSDLQAIHAGLLAGTVRWPLEPDAGGPVAAGGSTRDKEPWRTPARPVSTGRPSVELPAVCYEFTGRVAEMADMERVHWTAPRPSP